MSNSHQCECSVNRDNTRYNLSRVVRSYDSARCTRVATEMVGHLRCCKTHARMCRDGLVSELGQTLDPHTIREVRRYHRKYPNGFYTWATKRNTEGPQGK